MTTKVAIIGAGGMLQHHAAGFLSADAEIVAITDVNADSAAKAAKAWGISETFDNVAEMLEKASADAVSIIVPNKFHAPLAIQCLLAGKHVFCEKPPALNAAEVRHMMDAANASGKVLLFNFNNRARPESIAMMKLISSGQLGTINAAQAKWIQRTGIPGFGGWFTTKALSGGGPLIDLLHMIDLAMHFMGYPEPAHVLGQTFDTFISDRDFKGPWGIPDQADGTTDVETAAHGFVTFATGQVLALQVSWAEMVKREEVSVVFQGTAGGGKVERLFGDDGLDATAIDTCEIYVQENGSSVDRTIDVDLCEDMGRSRSAQNFILAVEGREPPLNLPTEALKLMQIIDAIYESARLGEPVNLGKPLMSIERKLRMGMVGGGRGAFIGAVHRMAAALDGKIQLVAGAFSADPEKSRLSGGDLFIDPARVYDSYVQMAEREADLPEDQRIDFVSIVARNDLHFDVAKTFLEAGFNIICEKPLAYSLEQARRLKAIVEKTGKVFGLTHNYTGYPMVKEARAMVQAGKLGRILKVVVEYPQGYAITALGSESEGQISNWRMDPAVSGVSNCIGDIGSHAENLARYIAAVEIEELAAELTTFIPGRVLDDDGNMLIRYKGGARGILYASQVSTGDENNLNIRVYGTLASLEWHQEHPNELAVKFAEQPRQIHRRGNVYNGARCAQNTRLPFGHPEGFIEAFANVYLGICEAIADEVSGNYPRTEAYDFPTIDDGVKGMAFIEAAVQSSRNNAAWTKL